MSKLKPLTKVFHSSEEIQFNNSSKIVIMSDCHRGDGSWGDNFSNNQNIYFAALNFYYNKKFTYIELGDGDELWENRNLEQIIATHSNVFWLLSKFYRKNRLYMLYGNHDMVKKKSDYVIYKCSTFFDESIKKRVPLFPNIKFHEGLILKNTDTGNKIFLTHGHQVDFLNYNLWKLSRFLVRYLWRPLELIGFRDPTSASKNHEKKNVVDKYLVDWAKKERQMIITGHTHRPVFPKLGEPLYFNDGSCVHPRCITAMEIQDGEIALIKWCFMTRKDQTLYVGREVLAGPVKLQDYFEKGSY